MAAVAVMVVVAILLRVVVQTMAAVVAAVIDVRSRFNIVSLGYTGRAVSRGVFLPLERCDFWVTAI